MLELKIPPVALALVVAACMSGLSGLVPAATVAIPGGRLAAAGVALAGLVGALAGGVALGMRRTTVNPFTPGAASALVTAGAFRFSRNPMYVGLLLALAGWALYLSNGLSALLVPVFVAYMNRFQIGPEERALRAKFGAQFDAYAAAVRRWL